VRIAYTGFEEPTVVGGSRIGDYVDTSPPDRDHMLANNAGENPVQYLGDQELGFRTWWFNIRSSNRGLSSVVGVVSDSMASENYRKAAHSGSQYYIMAGPNNFVVLESGKMLTGRLALFMSSVISLGLCRTSIYVDDYAMFWMLTGIAHLQAFDDVTVSCWAYIASQRWRVLRIRPGRNYFWGPRNIVYTTNFYYK
jgi:hypothetical protein